MDSNSGNRKNVSSILRWVLSKRDKLMHWNAWRTNDEGCIGMRCLILVWWNVVRTQMCVCVCEFELIVQILCMKIHYIELFIRIQCGKKWLLPWKGKGKKWLYLQIKTSAVSFCLWNCFNSFNIFSLLHRQLYKKYTYKSIVGTFTSIPNSI